MDYKETLHLPKTAFEMRAGLSQKEPRLLEEWAKADLYGQIQAARKDAPRFVMHDGPPYANGHLHHGHILNKILKDIAVKDHAMRGFQASFVPGWDCHGLPIEVQVDKELGKKKAEMSRAEVRRACRDYAQKFVAIQRDEFARLGVFARWHEPYLTMTYGYEAQTLRELGKFAGAGLLYKGLRPINWCTTHQTALAEAEVEYEDHTSPSVYVAFPLAKRAPGLERDDVDLVIWTTTPWTLPANLAIAVHPEFDYVAYPVGERLRIVAQPLVESFLAAVKAPALDESKIVARFKGRDLEGLSYEHPLFPRRSPVILAEHVTLEAGTGCVHTAPGHGPDDFEVGRKYGLEVLSPVDGRGVFTEAAGPFAGQQVFAANAGIIAALFAAKVLLNDPSDTVVHRYAHCWRCHKPIILRATEQWFVALDKPFKGGKTLRERALAALKEVQWIPPWGEDRIRGMLQTRPDWCLSRQRSWGVPIAVVYCDKCDTPLVSEARMNQAAAVFEREGADAWFTRSVAELFGDDLACATCGHKTFRKEEDILDVWFDSGVSYAAVIEREGLGQPEGPAVDLYLEGSDQHRGWFHSSLLCGLATRERPPFRTVLTHGFVVDGSGKKISKSKGNFVDPFVAIQKDGAELLRLWVAGEDYREDIRISQEILTRLADTYRKIRNTIRYLLGSLFDFDPNKDLVAAGALLPLDRYALGVAKRTGNRIDEAYRAYDFHVVLHRVNELCTVDLSAFYLDVLKDRLYASGKTSVARRSAQSALYLIARDLLRLMAPIFSFTAEEAWEKLPRLNGDPASVHLALHPGIREPEAVAALFAALAKDGEALAKRYDYAREVRRQVNVALEEARQQKKIGSSVEAMVTVFGSEAQLQPLAGLSDAELADLFIVSRARTSTKGDALTVLVENASGTKCARCWLYRDEVGASAVHPTLCHRCLEAL
ncbi:MAG: isoleucine--tRNA ligase [Deltaproteobacteria bacterium]|nr:isoleucine--tRNA ligase [Deltaproteobacteria bacterium]